MINPNNIFDNLDHNRITVHVLMDMQERYPNLKDLERKSYYMRTKLRVSLLHDFAHKNSLPTNKTLIKKSIKNIDHNLINEVLDDLNISEAALPEVKKTGHVFLFNGGPATGKSKFIKEMDIPQRTVTLDRDGYFDKLSPYSRIKNTHPDHATHAVVCEAILYNERDAYNYALLAGAENILVDGTMSYLDLGLEMIKNAQAQGYKVKIINLDCEIDTAIERAEIRAKKVGKTINPKLLYESHVRCSNNFFIYKEQADLSESWNSQNIRRLIYQNGKTLDKEALLSLKNKGKLPLDNPDWPPNFDEFLSWHRKNTQDFTNSCTPT